MKDDLLESRLDNWGRAQRDSKQWSHCRSIEHRYNARSDHDGDEVIVRESHYVGQVDLIDAELVNAAWLKVLYNNRMVLAYRYIHRDNNIKRICIKLGLRLSQYDAVFSNGKMALGKYLGET